MHSSDSINVKFRCKNVQCPTSEAMDIFLELKFEVERTGKKGKDEGRLL